MFSFFVFAAVSGKQMGWRGQRKRGSPRAGDLYSGPGALRANASAQAFSASAVSLCPFPTSVHCIVCPGPSAANSYLGLPPLIETLHASPLILKDQAKLQTPGYDIEAPQKPGLWCSPILPWVHSFLCPEWQPTPPALPSSPRSNSQAVLIHLCILSTNHWLTYRGHQ